MKTIEDEPKGLPPGRAVDLGDVNDVIDGENLALRHQTSGGIPTTGTTAEAGGGEERGLKRLLTDLRSYKELRRTPYGLGPITILAAISFFGYFDAQAFSVARPFIVRDLEIDIQDIIEIAQIVGVFTIFGALFIGPAGPVRRDRSHLLRRLLDRLLARHLHVLARVAAGPRHRR
jgi:hypothetical protein